MKYKNLKSYTVSAIVSTYKSEKFIEGCFKNLIEQTLYSKGELEIIVIDSNSPQNEKQIVEHYTQRYPFARRQSSEHNFGIVSMWYAGGWS